MLEDEPHTRTKIFEQRRKEMRPDPLPDETMVDILVKQKAKRQNRYNGLTKIIPVEPYNVFGPPQDKDATFKITESFMASGVKMSSPNRSTVQEVTMSLEESYGDNE